MSADSRLVVEPLGRHHDRPAFSCGEPPLDRYLQQQTMQDVKRRIARAFVAVEESAPTRILGFYTLSAISVAAHKLPQETAKRLPRHPIPAALIGRLAVDRIAQRAGIGRMLLMDAIHRALAASTEIAVFAVIVDAKNEEARRFYENYGFRRFPETPERLFLPLSSVAQ